MLERKRILRPVASQDEDVLVYEHLSSGETFVITNPHLSLAQIPDVQQEVAELLSGGGAASEAAPESASVDGTQESQESQRAAEPAEPAEPADSSENPAS